jgi:hypothetical protein
MYSEAAITLEANIINLEAKQGKENCSIETGHVSWQSLEADRASLIL